MNILPVLLLACTPLLDAPRAFESGGAPIAAVDVDQDGAIDVIAHAGGIAIQYGGNGTLGAPETLAADAAGAFAADVDGDGRIDVVGATGRDTYLLRNLGQRKFGARELLAAGEGKPVAVADFTSDGSPDVLIPRAGRSALLLRNDGTGHFTAEESSVLEDSPAVTGDVDGDGKLDLVHARSTERMIIERGDGNGRFTRRVMTFSSPATAALEDLDRDGRADLIAMFESDGELLVYRDALDFTKATNIAAGAPHATASGDFNGDGRPDLAVLSRSGTLRDSAPRVLVFLGDGQGRLAHAQDVLIGHPYGVSIAAADFNDDGVLDLVVPGQGSHLALVFGRGDGTFDSPGVLQNRRHTRLSQAVDLNGDGTDEVIGVDASGNFLVNGVQTDDGTYEFEWLPAGPPPFGTGDGYAIGDANEERWRTIFVATPDEIAVLSRSADGVWTRVRGIPGRAGGIASEDLDGDGRRELIAAGAQLRVLDANGNERFSTPTVPGVYRFAFADFNRDGNRDVAVLREGTSSPVPHPPTFSDGFVSIYFGRGDGTLEPELRIVSDAIPWEVRAGNFIGDASADLFVLMDGAVMLLRGDGRGGFARRRAPRVPFTHMADFDEDGYLDGLTSTGTLYRGTRGGLVEAGTYLLSADPTTFVLARRAPNARRTLVGAMGVAGEIYLVDTATDCRPPRGRTVRR